MEPLLTGSDYQDALTAFKERLSLHGRKVTILRFLSWATGGNVDGVAPTRNNTSAGVKALMVNVTPADQAMSNGFLQVGDVKTSTLFDLKEGKEGVGTTPQEADLMTYEGATWRLVGTPFRHYHGGGRISTDGVWRRV